MMTVEERIKMYKDKKAFIDNLSRALELSSTTVQKVDYVVLTKYNDLFKTDVYNEFIIVTYVGGVQSVRSVSGNSDAANLICLASLVEGDYYYPEIEYYENLLEEGFTEVDLEG
jgi:hypothetical protein